MLAFVKRRPHCFHDSLVLVSASHSLIIFECEPHLKQVNTKGCIKQATRLFQFLDKSSHIVSKGQMLSQQADPKASLIFSH